MSSKLLDSFQNTLCNNVADASADESSSVESGPVMGTIHTFIPAEKMSTAQHSYVHDAATDLRKGRMMH